MVMKELEPRVARACVPFQSSRLMVIALYDAMDSDDVTEFASIDQL